MPACHNIKLLCTPVQPGADVSSLDLQIQLLLDNSNDGGSLHDNGIKAVSALLTLFDLQEQLNKNCASKEEEPILFNMITVLDKVINDSCNYVSYI